METPKSSMSDFFNVNAHIWIHVVRDNRGSDPRLRSVKRMECVRCGVIQGSILNKILTWPVRCSSRNIRPGGYMAATVGIYRETTEHATQPCS